MKLKCHRTCARLTALLMGLFCLATPMTALAVPAPDASAALNIPGTAVLGGVVDTEEAAKEASREDAIKAVDNWINAYSVIYRYKFASTPGFSQGDIERYKAAVPLVTFKDGSSYLKASTNAMCEESASGETTPLTIWVRGTAYADNISLQQSLYHEIGHAIEYSRGDWNSPHAGSQAYQDRNVEYLDAINTILFNDLGRGFERFVQDNNKTFADRKAKWEEFVSRFDAALTANTTYGPSPVAVDLNQLKDWYGFNVSRQDFEAYYRSGKAGQAFVDFFKEYDKSASPSTTGKDMKVLTYQHPVITVNDVGVGKVTKTIGVSNTLSWQVEDNGYEAFCSAPNNQPIEIAGTIQIDPWDPNASWMKYDSVDYRFAVIASSGFINPWEGTVLFEKTGAIKSEGGSDSFSYKLDPSQQNSATQYYICYGYDQMMVHLTLTSSSSTTTPSDSTAPADSTTPSNTTTSTSYTVETSPEHPAVLLNGLPLIFDVPAQIINNRTLVPLRGIMEAVGAELEWNAATQGITATRGDDVIKLTIGNTLAYVNGQSTILDVPAMAINNRTLVPLRFVGESLGAAVDYDPENYVITVDMPDEDTTEEITEEAATNNNEEITEETTEDAEENIPETTSEDNSANTSADTSENNVVPPSGPEKLLVKVMSLLGVSNNPPNKSTFTLDAPATITKITTYHWNSGNGQTPGTIGIKDVSTGQMVGTWDAAASKDGWDYTPGAVWSMVNVPPCTWWAAQPGVTIPAGTYEVVDSDPATWSYTSETSNRGYYIILGKCDGNAGATAP